MLSDWIGHIPSDTSLPQFKYDVNEDEQAEPNGIESPRRDVQEQPSPHRERDGSPSSSSECDNEIPIQSHVGQRASEVSNPQLRRRWVQGLLNVGRGRDGPRLSDVSQLPELAPSSLAARYSLVTALRNDDSFASTASTPLDRGVLIRGYLIHVKGWWRKGPKLAERHVEIREVSGGGDYELVWHQFGKEGEIDFTQPRCIQSLSGCVVEAVDLPEHSNVYCLRIYLQPSHREHPMDFAAKSAKERELWLEAFSKASAHQNKDGTPSRGWMHIKVTNCTLPMEPRRTSPAFAEVFVVIRCGGMTSRTAPRRFKSASDTLYCNIDATIDFPIIDDNPDSIITFELWTSMARRKFMQHGRIDVPLYCCGRNRDRDLVLPLKDSVKPLVANSRLGNVYVQCAFEQTLHSLLLPRPTCQRQGLQHMVGIKSIREQLQDFEVFLKDFETFSSRFMHHCDAWRRISIMGRSVLYWDVPLVTLVCLFFITLMVGFFHEYILPLAVFVLLCFTMWWHPCCQKMWVQLQGQCGCGALGPAQAPQAADAGSREGETAQQETQELFENQRRPLFGRFATTSRLRFADLPPWSDANGHRANAPAPTVNGVHYVWRVEVNQFTDSDGWRYANHFGKYAEWRNAFQRTCYVRQRRHVGRPLVAPVVAESAPVQQITRRHSIGGYPSASAHVTGGQNGSSKGGGKGPEFGIAKTPYHDMCQQFLLRWTFLQRHIEFWMDWYERRKNLFLGVTLPTQNLALIGIVAVLIATWALPTRWLALAWTYSMFYAGLSTGRFVRRNRDTFINAFKDTAVTLWLDHQEAKTQAQTWGPRTSLDEVTDTGVQLLVLRDWIRSEFFEGCPMMQLRAMQRCATLGELAALVTWTSHKFARFPDRPKVWYRSTFRNLLDHVPSDVTQFQPFVCQGLGDGSDW